MLNTISFALPKGRLAEETIKLLVDKGIVSDGVVDFSSRKLIFTDEAAKVKFLLIRNSDVPAYVEHGAADFGVVGKDVLMEATSSFYEFADLKFGACRLCVAAPAGYHSYYKHNIRIATKFTNTTKQFFADKGVFVEVIKLYGSIEIAPLTGLADYIVDLVDSGETLRKNGLVEVETIMHSSARLIANQSLARAKYQRVKEILSVIAPTGCGQDNRQTSEATECRSPEPQGELVSPRIKGRVRSSAQDAPTKLGNKGL